MIQILSNPKKVAVSGWNQGIRSSSGDLICIVSAHSVYPKDYVSKCVEYSDKADNVGGGYVRVLHQDISALFIAFNTARDDVFGAGKSVFRQNAETPVYVDTVFGGCYRKEVFEKIGYFNENLQRSGDLEFNLRLKAAGMKTLYVPGIKSTYFARTGLWSFIKHNFKDGKWSLLMMKYSKVNFGKRRLVPALFLMSLPISLWPYLLILGLRSFQISKRERDWKLLFTLPIAFLSLHLSYGLGSLWAIPEYLGEKGR